jgi:hypothetical protein
LSLGTDLTNRAKTTDANVGDFSAGSYGTILGAEVNYYLFFFLYSNLSTFFA